MIFSAPERKICKRKQQKSGPEGPLQNRINLDGYRSIQISLRQSLSSIIS